MKLYKLTLLDFYEKGIMLFDILAHLKLKFLSRIADFQGFGFVLKRFSFRDMAESSLCDVLLILLFPFRALAHLLGFLGF